MAAWYAVLLLAGAASALALRASSLGQGQGGRSVSALRALSASEREQTARDLTSHSLWVEFDGLGVERWNAALELQSKFAVRFSRGLTSNKPGYWRVVKYEDGREQVEATHPVPPEYMFFFDLQDKQLLWRGDLDMTTRRVTNGVCIANKKRFGVLPYTETVATWTADVLLPGEALPEVSMPKLSQQRFSPPPDFLSPLDMDRYPTLFSDQYKRYFFAVEDALSKGQAPPLRPRPFFVPTSGAGAGAGAGSGMGAEEEAEDALAASRREIKVADRSRGTKGKGF